MKKEEKESIRNQEWAAKDRRLIKKEEKKLSKLNSKTSVAHYIHNASRMKSGREKMIVLMTVERIKIIKAKLDMPDGELAYLRKSQLMYTSIFENTSGFFSTLFNRLSIWDTQNTALDNALTDIENGVAEAEGDKITAMNDLRVTLLLALAYVNGLVLLNQRQAVAIIRACHMGVVGRGTHDAQDIEVKIGNASGEIIVKCMVAKEGPKKIMATYFVEVSVDDGRTWIVLDPSHPSKVVVNDLTPNKPVIARCRNWTKNGWSEWSVSKPVTPY